MHSCHPVSVTLEWRSQMAEDQTQTQNEPLFACFACKLLIKDWYGIFENPYSIAKHDIMILKSMNRYFLTSLVRKPQLKGTQLVVADPEESAIHSLSPSGATWRFCFTFHSHFTFRQRPQPSALLFDKTWPGQQRHMLTQIQSSAAGCGSATALESARSLPPVAVSPPSAAIHHGPAIWVHLQPTGPRQEGLSVCQSLSNDTGPGWPPTRLQ